MIKMKSSSLFGVYACLCDFYALGTIGGIVGSTVK